MIENPTRRPLSLISLVKKPVVGKDGALEAATVIKLATLVPEGSVWDKALREMGASWKEVSDGDVALRIYPGGVAGSEHDVLRKMRIGQLQAGSLTTVGLEQIDPGFKVLTVPLFYESYEEFFFVLDGLAPGQRYVAHGGFELKAKIVTSGAGAHAGHGH